MSCTDDKYALLDYLKTIPYLKERQNCLKLYLCKTKGPFFVHPTGSVRKLHSLKINHTHHLQPGEQLPHYKDKYTIFSVLLSYIQQRRGDIDSVVKFQLASDCQSRADLIEFTYHLFKSPPLDTFIYELLTDYATIFCDNHFDDFQKQLMYRLTAQPPPPSPAAVCSSSSPAAQIQDIIASKNELYKDIETPKTICDQHSICFIYGCNLSKDKFYVIKNLTAKRDSSNKPITLANTFNRRSILNYLKEYIKDCFIVNKASEKNRNLPAFILHPQLKPIAVSVYNNLILDIA